MKLYLVLFFLLSAFSCAPMQLGQPQNLSSSGFAVSSLDPSEEDLYLKRDDSYLGGSQRNAYYKPFPMDSNEFVDRWVRYYSRGAGRNSMKRHLERSNRYVNLMQSVLGEERGFPLEIVYMSMTESGFDPYAKSSQKALGYWQFIPSTGRMYGLKINHAVDERRDFVLSTQAAREYMIDLYYKVHQDWRLAMAAYNAGPGVIQAAIKKYDSKNFWYLVSRASDKELPRETKNHVPKVIAMRKIALSPERYGFYDEDLNYHPPLDYQLVALTRDSSLSHIARHLQIHPKELRSLNPKYKTDLVPLEGQKTYIRVPSHVRI